MQYLKKLKVKLVRGEYKNPIKGQVRSPEQIYTIFKSIKDDAQETLIGVYLDNTCEVIAYNVLSVGTLSATIVEPREIFGYGFVLMARYFILIHNHPRGGPTPSSEDRKAMKWLIKCSKIMKMSMLDFMIVGDLGSRKKKNYWSMFEENSLLHYWREI